MDKIYYTIEHYKDGSVHEMRIGKQLKRAKDAAERMLSNLLVDKVDIIWYMDDMNYSKIATIARGN